MAKNPSKKESKTGFPWSSLAYIFIVIILYIPLVFIGVRTFLPQYADYYLHPQKECYMYNQYPETVSAEERQQMQQQYDACFKEQQAIQQQWEEEKRQYDVWKYLTVLGVVLITLAIVLFVPLDGAIRTGLFIGSAISVFVATIQYFETESKIAFVILVVVFGLVMFVIQKREKFIN